MKKKTAKYLLKVLEKTQKLNNKSFEKMMESGTSTNKDGLRNSKINEHLEDIMGILVDEIGDFNDF